jgi:hypothetical protein
MDQKKEEQIIKILHNKLYSDEVPIITKNDVADYISIHGLPSDVYGTVPNPHDGYYLITNEDSFVTYYQEKEIKNNYKNHLTYEKALSCIIDAILKDKTDCLP